MTRVHDRMTSLAPSKPRWITRLQQCSSSASRTAGFGEHYKGQGPASRLRPDFTPSYVPLKRLVRKACRERSPHLFIYQLLSNNKKSHAHILQYLMEKRCEACLCPHLAGLPLHAFISLMRLLIPWFTPKEKLESCNLAAFTPADTSTIHSPKPSNGFPFPTH